MRKILLGTLSGLLLVAAAAVVLRTVAAEPVAAAQGEISQHHAAALQRKIDAVQSAQTGGKENVSRTINVSEVELESFLVYGMRDEIPARVDAVDVQLTEGAVAADTRLTFPSNSTGNPMVDVLIAGTHSLYLKGKLNALQGRGRFELEEVHVDGIPVPNILIETLIAKYVKPRYPEVDLNEPFVMPWNIDSLKITPGKATITY